MSDALQFAQNYMAQVASLVDVLDKLRLMNDRLAQDATLVTRYFSGQGSRSDIVALDVTNAQSAVTQLLFTFDSGTPTQKSYLFKLL